MRLSLLGLTVALLGCQAKRPGQAAVSADSTPAADQREEPPVPLNADSPMTYPAALASERLGGTVLLRLFIDSTGIVVKESTAVQESSGYPALDTAAMVGAPRLRYAPALRDGVPVAALFLQPIKFRTAAGGATPP